MAGLSEQEIIRREKLAKLRALGIDPILPHFILLIIHQQKLKLLLPKVKKSSLPVV